MFGAASAAYQVEGAWNVSDKGENKWDRLVHRYPDLVRFETGDDACKSYYYWERDIEMAAEVGLQFYRLSINWPRLLPTGLADRISEDGKRFYNNLIDGLLRKGIEPVVTIFHWEMPQMFQELGGWTNPMISEWFVDYARVVFNLYGDRVKYWITINEPIVECDFFFGQFLDPKLPYYVGPYLCNKNLLLAHAKAWRLYDEEFKHKYHGKVSISNHLVWVKPHSPEYQELAEASRQYLTGRYTHAIYSKEGGWPPVVEETIARVSKEQGFRLSRLPPFTQAEVDLIRGTYDFFAMNCYTSRLVRRAKPGETYVPTIFSNIFEYNAILDVDPEWFISYSSELYVDPPSLREQMAWLKQQYGDIEIFITENGYPATGSNLEDDVRVTFLRAHLEQVLLSIYEDGVNVTAYAYWTLMDNFEWLSGYETKFGLFQVDFSDPKRKRTPRNSAFYYSDIIKSRSLIPVSDWLKHSGPRNLLGPK